MIGHDKSRENKHRTLGIPYLSIENQYAHIQKNISKVENICWLQIEWLNAMVLLNSAKQQQQQQQ